MKIERTCSQDDDVIFTNDLCNTYSYLKTIKDINFTSREIDIIACIISCRSSKKIASFLSISPKTVENYVHNIMSKLNCNSREHIIDFIEKSDKVAMIRNHYLNLLMQVTFELELKNLFACNQKKVNCVIFFYKDSKNKNVFISTLEKHLAIAGINTACKLWENSKSENFITQETNAQSVNFIIYILSNSFVSKLKSDGYDITEEILKLMSVVNKTSRQVLLITTANNILQNLNIQSDNFNHLELNTQKNYYMFVFELLKQLLPLHNITQHIEAFTKQYDALEKSSYIQIPPNSTTNNHYTKKSLQKKDMLLSRLTMIFVTIICLIICYLALNKASQFTLNKQLTFLTKQKKTVLLNLPPRNNKFIGRNYALTQIKKQLDQRKTGIITQAIAGLGGVGKTQLVTEFAYQAATQNNYGIILWVTAENHGTMNSAYREFAELLQIDIRGLSLDESQMLVHHKLVKLYENSKILFVLDNATNPDDIQCYIDKLSKQFPSEFPIHILITSRSQHWPDNPLILDTFTYREALAFVNRHLPNESKTSMIKLIKSLHYFPLALNQATAYIKKHTNIDDYLELYAARQKNYLDTFSSNTNQYTESLWKTWDIALAKLSNPAKEILFISSYLDPDNIPIAFFDAFAPEARSDAIEDLRKHSFIILTNNNKSFKIHRLLQDVIRTTTASHTNEKFYGLLKAIDLLKLKFDFDYMQPERWKDWAKYLAHAKTISTHAIGTSGKPLQQGLKLYIKYALFLTYIEYDIQHALIVWNKILLLMKQYYANQPAKLILANINTHIGFAKNWLGQFKETQEFLSNYVIPIYQQSIPRLNPEERELLNLLRIISFNDISSDQIRNRCDLNFALEILKRSQYKLGFVQEALTVYKDAFKVSQAEPLDDISQRYKINTLWSNGRIYMFLGYFIKAEKILEAAKKGTDELYASHPRQASAYANLAFLLYHLGKFDDAIKLLNKCASIRLSNFPAQHLQNTDTQIKSGFTNYISGDVTTAMHNFTEAISIYKLYYRDTDSVYIFTNLGFWKIYETIGEYDKATDYMQTTLNIAKAHYKNNINSGMAFQLTEAENWPKLINNSDASYWQCALDTSTIIFGKNHYQAARYHYMLGQVLEHKNNLKQANDHYKQSLVILNTQEIRHPNLKQFYLNNTRSIQDGIQRTNKI